MPQAPLPGTAVCLHEPDLCHLFCLQLEKLYPDRLMKLQVMTSSAPSLTITPGGLSLMPVVDIQAYAILSNSSLAPLFLLSLVSMGTACAEGPASSRVGIQIPAVGFRCEGLGPGEL